MEKHTALSALKSKAQTVAKALNLDALADDSGLCVDALGGAPGIFSARYSGEHGDDAANNALLLKNLEGVSDRSARFVCALACVFPSGEELCVRGTAEGKILTAHRGQGGFGYDPLFYFPPLGKTFGELSAEEKNKHSHRSNAIELLAKELKENNLIK